MSIEKVSVDIKGESSKKYDIQIGQSLLEKVSDLIDLKKYSKIAVLTDENVAPHWLEKLKSGLCCHSDFSCHSEPTCHPELVSGSPTEIIIKPGEEHKNLQTLEQIWKQMKSANMDRKSLLINLGGGVVCDMGGFAASCYMRGIDFLQVPTTLLSQVDASVGGKTAVDLDGIKNIVGAFAQPIGVIIDVDTLFTLPKREFQSGFGEIIKHGLIQDEEYFNLLHSKNLKKLEKDDIKKIIQKSCEIKQKVVSEDEKEGGIRKILNFGHTLGHAIETLGFETKTPLLHGEAISLGIIAALKISELKGFEISETDIESTKECLENYDLPTTLAPEIKSEDILKMILHDKKNEKSKVKWVLLEKIGKPVFDVEVEDEIIKKAIEYIKN